MLEYPRAKEDACINIDWPKCESFLVPVAPGHPSHQDWVRGLPESCRNCWNLIFGGNQHEMKATNCDPQYEKLEPSRNHNEALQSENNPLPQIVTMQAEMSPASFLHRLGIQPNQSDDISSHFNEAVEVMKCKWSKAGKDFGGRDFGTPPDTMSAELMNLWFTDEQMAAETLGSNFDRLVSSMERLANSPVFANGRLNRICELGGGSGVLGMWLASCSLCNSCQIVDYARNALTVGRQWAAGLALPKVEFRHASYADVASAGSYDFDLVFAEAAIDVGGEADLFVVKRCRELAEALRKQVRSDSGVGLIVEGPPNAESLPYLCEALRAEHLAIDWKLSSNKDVLVLYVRPQEGALAGSLECDVDALLA